MFTRYLVNCAHLGCGWSGRLWPKLESDSRSSSVVGVLMVSFECPRCREEWQARIIGNEVESLPVETWEEDLEPVLWPPVDIGVGD